MPESKINREPLILLEIVVCLVGTGTGVYFGAMSGMMYKTTAGAILSGLIGGLSGGLLWSLLIVDRIRKAKGRLAFWGTICGAFAGILANMILHIPMTATSASSSLAQIIDNILIGMQYAIPAGLIMGILCAELAESTAKRALAVDENQHILGNQKDTASKPSQKYHKPSKTTLVVTGIICGLPPLLGCAIFSSAMTASGGIAVVLMWYRAMNARLQKESPRLVIWGTIWGSVAFMLFTEFIMASMDFFAGGTRHFTATSILVPMLIGAGIGMVMGLVMRLRLNHAPAQEQHNE